ncbi:MAG: acyltransferase [Litoreibacter sp.]|nr:acyltransferase [Litoreibacter sp.]
MENSVTHSVGGDRLVALDGLRGVAILLVLAYHFLARFPDFYPYGEAFAAFASSGFLGVQLFFVISGFVIALTLQNCPNIPTFLVRRLARLWPPIFVCSILTFTVMHVIDTPFTEYRRVGVQGFLPSLTFIGPEVWLRFVDGAKWIDGAYWTLFVEVRFYFWAAIVYFIFSRQLSFVLFWASLLAAAVAETLYSGPLSKVWDLLFFPRYLPFFAVGAITFDIWRGETKYWQWPAVAILVFLCCYREYSTELSLLTAFLVALCFVPSVLFCVAPRTLSPLEMKPLVWLGRRSYSLYLLHQNIGVALITLAVTGLAMGVYVLIIFATIFILVLLSHLLFETIEERSHKLAKFILGFAKRGRLKAL